MEIITGRKRRKQKIKEALEICWIHARLAAVHACMHMYVHVYVRIYMYIHMTYVHVRTYIYTYVCTHKQSFQPNNWLSQFHFDIISSLKTP